MTQREPNPNCDRGLCKNPEGEIRRLPIGGDGAMLLCQDCYRKEIKARKEFNQECGEKLWETPKWSDLELYDVT